MQKFTTLDETELALFHALEIAPRAPWTAVGAAVGIDPVTAARRWEAMESSGRAYVSAYPLITRASAASFAEIRCRPDRVRAVAATIARDPYAMSVDVVSGGSGLLLLAAAASVETLNRYVLDRLPAVPGVDAVVSQPVIAIHVDGGFAAAGALEPRGLSMLPARRRGTLLPSFGRVDDLDWRICLALTRAGRASVADLSRETGASSSTVARRLGRLIADGALHVRVQLVPSAVPRQAVVWLGIRVPPAQVSDVVRDLGRVAGVTSVSLVAGRHNLLVKVTLPHLAALEAFEASVHQTNPGIQIANRMVVLERVRHVARLFDSHGEVAEVVSVDLR